MTSTNNSAPVSHPIPIRQGMLILLAVWTVIISVSLIWTMCDFQQMIIQLATIEANASFNNDLSYRRWAAKQGGVYVVPSAYTPPNPHLSFLPNRDLTTTAGVHLTLVNPAYMTRQVHEMAKELFETKSHITSLNPIRPENGPDLWERQALESFANGINEVSSQDTTSGTPYLRFMRPIITEKPCLKCHAHQGYKTGDIRGGISVSVPMGKYYALRKERFSRLIFLHLIVYGVGWAGLALGTRRIQAKIIENERIQADLNTKKNNLSLFRSLIDQANDSLFIVDPDTSRLLDINERAAHVLGFKQRHLLTKSVMDIDPTFPDIQAWNAHVQEMKNREQMTINSHHRCQDGTLMPVEVTLRYLTHDQQDFIIASSRDITERKLKEIELEQYQTQLETMVEERTAELRGKTVDLEMSQQELESANLKLQELDRLKSMFIASMSHELRTPLNSIIGFSSILLEEWPGPLNPEQRTNQAIILNNGRHLLSLINDIIDISKIEAGMLESQDMEFDLDELIAETTINFSQEAHNKGISLNTNPCACRLLTDRRRLLQCLINLVSNAVKFTEHGMVSVYAKKLADSRIAISVNDTGIGISTEDQARLFTPFLRLEPSNNKYPGTGLGLYLSHKLANEVLQGDLTVVSALNQGSTFTLIIPTRRARGEVVKKINKNIARSVTS